MNGTASESQARKSRAGTYLALTLVTLPAIGVWIVVIWLTFERWTSGGITSVGTIAGLVVVSWIATLLTLLARVGWKQRKRAKRGALGTGGRGIRLCGRLGADAVSVQEGTILERRSDWVRDTALLVSGSSLLTSVLIVGFVAAPFARYMAGEDPLEGTNPVAYAIALSTISSGSIACSLGALSRQRGRMNERGIVLPWSWLVHLRKDRHVEYDQIADIRFLGKDQLGRAIIVLRDGRRKGITISDFEDPAMVSQRLQSFGREPSF